MVLAILFLDIANDDKGSILPPPTLLGAIDVCFDPFSDRFALIPTTIVLSAILPGLDTYAFRFSVGPLPCVDLTIWKLTHM